MDEDCLADALLDDVVQQGKSDRQAIHSVECDPEKAWLDGYVAGWFKGYFQRTPGEPFTEPLEVVNLTEPNR